METLDVSRFRNPLLVVAAALVIWGVLGALDIRNQTYRGFVTDGNNTITQVTDGGPADVAGLETGDYIRSIGGIAVEDLAAAVQRSRPEVNEVRTFEVERDGQALSFDLTYAALPMGNALVSYGVVLVGFLFLVCGVWAFLTVPTRRTLLLSALGVAFSAGFMAGPYFTSAAVRTVVGVVVLLMIVVGFAVLTHFLLVFPKRKRTLERRGMTWAVYAPAVVVGCLSVWFLVAQPAATSAVNVFFRALFGLFVVVYFGASLIALIHSFVTADAQERAASGLNLLLLGAVVGLGPSLVISIVGLVAPQVVVPGARFLPLLIGVLPVTLALAAVKGERRARPSEDDLTSAELLEGAA
ncbi:MAG: PDZ domain-containing protein [Gemmatimonadota bacterium]|nr:MAG: PDZ domain-containing protein [Gemmatimonadota bacterium]